MKANIHPKYYDNAQVICACGNRLTVGLTEVSVRVELCNKCHPFYTGEEKFVDTEDRIQKFRQKQQVAKQYSKKTVKKQEEKQKKEQPKTLREMLQAVR